MGFKFVAALSDNNVIGVGDKLPWHIKEDLKRFKEITDGGICLMGRKTYDSMKPYFKGEVLPGRLKYVLTRDEGASIDGAIAVSLETAIELGKRNTVYVIGGGEIYNLFLQWADELFLTRVHTHIEETDETVFFPVGIEGFDLIESTPIVTTAFSFDFEHWARSHE